jgi:tetratricopeptide (TPR) repeat protein
MRHRFLLSVGFSCLLALASSRAEAKEQWTEASSEHFALMTNAGEGRAAALLDTAERFRYVLSQVLPELRLFTREPARIYGFRDLASLDSFLPPTDEGGPRISGYFRTGATGAVIVLDLENGPGAYERVLFHEYAHLALSLDERGGLPLWFEEGLSEFYAGTRLGADDAEIGVPDSRLLNVFSRLSRRDILPLEEVLRARDGARWLESRETGAFFYAESWVLVHYLLAGSPEEGARTRLARFLARSSDGADPVESFRESFGIEPAAMEAVLRRYVDEGRLPRVSLALSGLDFARDVVTRRMTSAEVEHRWGALFLATGRLAEARVCLEEALRLDAALGGAWETLGFLRLEEGDPEDAKEAFRRALDLDAASATGSLAYARILLHDYRSSVGSIPDGIADEATRALKRSVALSPGSRDSAELLAFVYLVRGYRLDEAQALVETALDRTPHDGALLYLKGQILAKRGLYERARNVLNRVADETADEGLRRAAHEFLSRMAEVEKAPGR